jgi:integrase
LSIDKKVAQAMLTSLVRQVERQKAGLFDPVDEQRRRPLKEHLEDYRAHLVNRGVTTKQVREATSQIGKMAKACRWWSLADITPHSALKYLGEGRRNGWSAQTFNHHLKSARAFTRWLLRERRNALDPLGHLVRLNVAIDRRHDRRALSTEEFQRLIGAARAGQAIEGLSGPDRAMMYVLAAWTGFRKSEIGSLTLRSFALEADPPTATVAASFSKRRRQDTQVLHPQLVTELKTWLASLPMHITASEPLFKISGRAPGGIERKTHKMIRLDLAAARVTWLAEVDDPGQRRLREASDFLSYTDHLGRYADFHSCRHLFITHLERARISPRLAQTLARHSDIRLTLQVYTHLELQDQTAAIRSLPGPPGAG